VSVADYFSLISGNVTEFDLFPININFYLLIWVLENKEDLDN